MPHQVNGLFPVNFMCTYWVHLLLRDSLLIWCNEDKLSVCYFGTVLGQLFQYQTINFFDYVKMLDEQELMCRIKMFFSYLSLLLKWPRQNKETHMILHYRINCHEVFIKKKAYCNEDLQQIWRNTQLKSLSTMYLILVLSLKNRCS
jgi:hypothetical protein